MAEAVVEAKPAAHAMGADAWEAVVSSAGTGALTGLLRSATPVRLDAKTWVLACAPASRSGLERRRDEIVALIEHVTGCAVALTFEDRTDAEPAGDDADEASASPSHQTGDEGPDPRDHPLVAEAELLFGSPPPATPRRE